MSSALARGWLAQESSTAGPRESWASVGTRAVRYAGIAAGAVALHDIVCEWDTRITVAERLARAATEVGDLAFMHHATRSSFDFLATCCILVI